jgi:ATP-dependent exoDNAse (exonuclease V) alpha subunit
MHKRPTKGEPIPRADLQNRWQVEAKALGVNHPVCRTQESVRIDYEKLIKDACRHATERDVRFKREKVEAFALASCLGAADWSVLEQGIDQSTRAGQMIPARNGQYTTLDALDVERRLLCHLEQGRSHCRALVETLPSKCLENTTLNQGQREALVMTLQSKDQFIMWQGVAGAGKTFAMNQLRTIVEGQGIRCRGFAPSAEAAKGLSYEAQMPTDTVSSLLVGTGDRDGQWRMQSDLWIVDEAGLLSARDCERLMARARDEGARVLFVGDGRQLSSVEAGNPFRMLQKKGIEKAELTESLRFKDKTIKMAAQDQVDGSTLSGLRALAPMTKVFSDSKERIDHIVSEYTSLAPDVRAKTLVLAGTHAERDVLTDKIRAKMLRGKDQVALHVLVVKDLTRKEREHALKIEPGDRISYYQTSSKATQLGIKKDTLYEVQCVDSVRKHVVLRDTMSGKDIQVQTQQASAFSVYKVATKEFAVGDQVRWLKNDRTRALRNGQEFVIEDISEHVALRDKDGKLISIDRRALHLDHNYVSTVYSSQGKTCERVIISTDSSFGKEAMYVATTRAKSVVSLYTDDIKAMEHKAVQSQAKESAIDVVQQNRCRGKGIAMT